MSTQSTVIVAARRTPIGAFQGTLGPATAPELGSAAIKACLDDAGLGPTDVQELLFGNVLPAGVGQAPARQAGLGAGLEISTPCTTINKVCGSGMKAAMLGHDLIAAGSAAVVVSGGMESMSNAPYMLPKARSGYRMGHQEVIDHMFFDGLQDPFEGHMMGHYGEETANRFAFTRDEQDAFSIQSVKRALAAAESGAFDSEIVPVVTRTRKGETTVTVDEEPLRCDLERIPTMRPAFAKDGTITAASSSSISDGAAALVLMTASEAKRRGLEPLARIVAHSQHAHEPQWFTTTPIFAVRKLHDRLGWSPDAVDLYEINEAFACVTMAAIRELGIDAQQINVNGGACALGHPIGATGARLIVTLLHALRQRKGKRGIASLCIGGGEAVAIALEIP